MKRLAGNSMLVLASVGFALLVADVLLRVLGVSYPVFARVDPVLGVAHIPGAQGWYTVEGRSYVRINASGWRGKDRPLRKPAGVTRIAILGDSYAEALQVAEDSAFPSILERNLNTTLPGRYEVLNFGVSGYGTGQELLVLQHYALHYAPDAVILALTENDISDNSRALRKVDYLPYFRLVDGQLMLDTSYLSSRALLSAGGWRAQTLAFLLQHWRVAQLGRAARLGARKAVLRQRRLATANAILVGLGVFPEIFLNPPPDSTWTDAWNITERLITRMNVECRSRDIAFYLVMVSNGAQVTPDTTRRRAVAAELGVPDLFQPERRLERLGIRAGFDVFPLGPVLASQATATHAYYHGFGESMGTGHWNERGHRAAATLVSTWLGERLGRPPD